MNHNYTKLDIWIESRELVKIIYKKTSSYPKSETYGLVSQMRRAAISVSSNITEGSAFESKRMFARYLNIALGSLYELECQCYLSSDLDYINRKDSEWIIIRINNLKAKIKAFKNKVL